MADLRLVREKLSILSDTVAFVFQTLRDAINGYLGVHGRLPPETKKWDGTKRNKAKEVADTDREG